MMLMIPQAARVLGCERFWLNISATLFFLSFHAGSHLTVGVASWTWSTFAVALDLKRKFATKSCIASFLDPNLDPKKGRYKISPPLKFTAPASTFRPCSTCVSCSGAFFPRRVLTSSSSSSSSSSSRRRPPPLPTMLVDISTTRALGGGGRGGERADNCV